MGDDTGHETRLAPPAIGEVELLKVGCRCYSGSGTEGFIKTLKPGACVITNVRKEPDRKVPAGIIRACRHKNIYVTGCENGVLAVVGGGRIAYYGNICK